jgi:hypothetical protein
MYAAFRSPARPPARGNPLPPTFDEALRRTPIGLEIRSRLTSLFSGGALVKRLKVVESQTLVVGARGDTQSLADRIEITICVDPATPDRMSGWSRAEILNVVGVHEACHIETTQADIYADDCGCTFCQCHQTHFDQELISRFQYSLIHRAESATREGWLARYVGYFAAVNAFRADPAYRKLCDEMARARATDRAGFSNLIRDHEAANAPKPGGADLAAGQARALDLYRTALAGLEAGAERFSREGAFAAIEPYQQVIAKISDYKADTGFALIP